MKEKRRRARAPLDVYLNKYVSGVPYMVRGKDISRDGLQLAHLIEPSSGAKRVGLQFQLPGSEEVIYAEGEVVREWVGSDASDGSGIKFTLLTERHQRMIEAYVSRQGA
ncbi:MAG TPA: PilZ domain-containing protein, partial [Myxococcaceae bacterium]